MEDSTLTVGQKLKSLRVKANMTLKQVSELTDLSISFLSQVERGRATLGLNAMRRVAAAFNTNVSFFFNEQEDGPENPVVHSYERPYLEVSSQFIQYQLNRDWSNGQVQLTVTELFPSGNAADSQLTVFNHINEEIIYVLEGTLTVTVEKQQYVLYPRDSICIKPNTDHTWANHTNNIVRLLSAIPSPKLLNKE